MKVEIKFYTDGYLNLGLSLMRMLTLTHFVKCLICKFIEHPLFFSPQEACLFNEWNNFEAELSATLDGNIEEISINDLKKVSFHQLKFFFSLAFSILTI